MRNDNKEFVRNCVRHDAFDRMAYEEIYSQAKELQDLTEQGVKMMGTFASLGEDVFFSLYKTNPELIGQDDIEEKCILNYEMVSKLMESQSYQDLKQYTQLDELGSGLGSKALLEALLKQIQQDRSLKEAVQKINEVVEQQETITVEETGRILLGMQNSVRQAVEFAIDKAVFVVEELENVITSWGLNQGEFRKLPYDKKLEFLQVLRSQQKFKDMTRLVGRMRNIATGSRKAKLQNRIELHSITQGADINHVLPQELLALRRPALKLDFYRRMMERQLLQYDLNHREYIGQGPIIALIDTSSSMRGEREVWSKAVALGLAEIAEKERRAFSYALFASRKNELRTDDFQIGQRSPDKLMKLATEFIGGGTNFEQPLNWAVNKINESKFKKADIVMITDGECAIDDSFLKELLKAKVQKEFRVYSILISSNPRELNLWSDEIWRINDLLDDSVAKALFGKI